MNISRRGFIRMSAGASLLVAPVLRQSRAVAAGPKRLVFFHFPLGTVRSNYIPTGTGSAFTLSRILQPLEPWKSKLLIIDGLVRNVEAGSGGGNHKEQGTLLTGRTCDGVDNASKHTNISVDQFIRDRLPANLPVKSLELMAFVSKGSFAATVASADRVLLSARGPAQPVIPEADPLKAFDRVFAGVSPSGGGGGGSAGPDPALRARRKSVLDAVAKEIASLQARLSGSERAKLDQHLTSIRELEKRLATTQVVTAAGCSLPGRAMGLPYSNTTEAWTRAQIDIVAHSMACDLARVAVISHGAGRDNPVFAGVTTGPLGWHDDYTHGSSGYEEHTKIHSWYVTQFAYMVKKFADLGLLDSSALVHFTEQGARGSGFPTEHNGKNGYPYLIAGSCGGYFKQGQLVNVNGKGTKDFLFNCLRAMDLQDTMMGNVGGGPIPELAA